jgi:propanol-preferring alcohol dehydrogenase
MKAAKIFEDLSLRIEDTEKPRPVRGEALVRIHAAGVCGTDLHIMDGMIKPDSYPMTIGHEAAGVVEAVGEGVDIDVGTRVALYNKFFCGRCEQCHNDRQNLCDDEPGQLGFNRDGGDAEYAVLPAKNLVQLPNTVDFGTAAVLTCAGMTAIHATKLSRLQPSETAIVHGIGGVGIIVVQVAKRVGARVLAIADSEEKLQLARDHGASDGTVVSTKEGYEALPAIVRDLTNARGTDVFFELVGTKETMTAGIRCLAKHGRFISTGYTDQSLEIHPIELILSEASILSTVAATKQDLSDAVSLAAEGGITVPISARYPLDGLSEALATLRKRAVIGRQILELA